MNNWFLGTIFSYPVAEEQLRLLNLVGINGEISLVILRGLTFLLLLIGLGVWFKTIKRLNNKLAKLSVVAIFISPLFLVLWLVYPLICLKILIFVIGLYWGLKRKIIYIVLGIILVLFNLNVLGNKPSVLNKIDLKDAQVEVTKRISSEDTLLESIDMPLWWRRISYNKYFFSYKQIVAETIPFFDFESIFFQEINPLAQKSIVIFYWSEIYLFILGLYFIFKTRYKELNKFLLATIGLAWLDFVFSEGAIFKRLVLVLFPISLIIAAGFYNLLVASRSNWGARLLVGVISVLVVLGTINSVFDLSRRREWWMDNRPLAFEFWFKEIQKLDLQKYNRIQVTTLVGDAKSYCYFYLGNRCNEERFDFDSFDLSTNKGDLKSVYAGFGGEFVGPRFKNDISQAWVYEVQEQGIKIIKFRSLRDTIANRYGNDIGVGVVE